MYTPPDSFEVIAQSHLPRIPRVFPHVTSPPDVTLLANVYCTLAQFPRIMGVSIDGTYLRGASWTVPSPGESLLLSRHPQWLCKGLQTHIVRDIKEKFTVTSESPQRGYLTRQIMPASQFIFCTFRCALHFYRYFQVFTGTTFRISFFSTSWLS